MTRCPACPGVNACVPADGPQKCDLLFIGEAPGITEQKKLRPFVGKTGDEVNRGYLPILGRNRENTRFDNAISCLPITPQGKLLPDRERDLDLLQSCAAHHLYPEIERCQPRLIIPMGGFACRAIDPSINLELQHGMPVETAWGTAFPMYHPAGGIHEPKKMLQIRTDWVRLGKYIKGKLRVPVDKYAGLEDYQHIEDPEEVDALLEGHEWDHLAMDTEVKRTREPYCMTFSREPGTGYLLMADSPALDRFRYWLARWRGLLLFHNWLFDGEVFRQMGMEYNKVPSGEVFHQMNMTYSYRRVRDTMQRAFILGNVPLGLKALAYRELGMTMQDFDDLVTPHSIPLVLDYYRECSLEEWGKPEPEMVRDASGEWKLYKPQGFNTKLKRFFTDYNKNLNKDVFKMWDNWEDLHEVVEERMGRWPGRSIEHAAAADFPAVVKYACLSADSRVLTLHGYARIGDLVKSHSDEQIPSYNPSTREIEERKIIGWHRMNHDSNIQWLSLETKDQTPWGRGNSITGTRYTPDHRLLTPSGWVRIDQLTPGDYICMPSMDLDTVQRQVVIGSLLGDADLTKRNKNGSAAFRFSHCWDQWDYAVWKKTLLEGANLSVSVGLKNERDKWINGHLAHSTAFIAMATCHHPALKQLREISYPRGVKTVGPWCDPLDALGLAIWYQDDGCIVRGRGDGYSARIYTLGFSEPCVAYLRDLLRDKFGLPTSTTSGRRAGQRAIAINTEAAYGFFETVAPWIHPTMQYKLPMQWRGRFVQQPDSALAGLVTTEVKKVFHNPLTFRGSLRTSYCIDVEGTHNFFTQFEVAHNCRDADATLRLWLNVLRRMWRQVRRKPQEFWSGQIVA